MNQTAAQALQTYIGSYSRFESAIQEAMTSFCAAACGSCSRVCCQIAFCRESLDSPFLKRVAASSKLTAVWSGARGWLTQTGCALPAGRPPVCYAFLCNSIVQRQPTSMHAYALNVLSLLMTFVGRRARAGRHLVELTDLKQLNLERLQRQLETGRVVLSHLKGFWRHSGDNPLPIGLMRRICNPGAFGVEEVAAFYSQEGGAGLPSRPSR